MKKVISFLDSYSIQIPSSASAHEGLKPNSFQFMNSTGFFRFSVVLQLNDNSFYQVHPILFNSMEISEYDMELLNDYYNDSSSTLYRNEFYKDDKEKSRDGAYASEQLSVPFSSLFEPSQQHLHRQSMYFSIFQSIQCRSLRKFVFKDPSSHCRPYVCTTPVILDPFPSKEEESRDLAQYSLYALQFHSNL